MQSNPMVSWELIVLTQLVSRKFLNTFLDLISILRFHGYLMLYLSLFADYRPIVQHIIVIAIITANKIIISILFPPYLINIVV